MPHLRLEYSTNILEQKNLPQLFEKLHVLLAEILPSKIASCASRAIPCDIYHIADGNPKNAFVHLEIKILTGRTPETLNHVGTQVMAILQNYFSESTKHIALKITLEIIELQQTYFH